MKSGFLRLSILFFFFFVILSRAQTINEQKVYDLKYNLAKDTKFNLKNFNITNQFRKQDGTKTLLYSRTRDLEIEYTVIDLKDTTITFEIEYKKKYYKGPIRDGNELVDDFSNIIGKKVQYTMSTRGNLGNLDGFKDLPDYKMSSGAIYTGAMLREEIEHMFMVLPGKPIKLGDSWKREAFGISYELKALEEVKINGYDCVRIFARIEEYSNQKSKDRDGSDVSVEIYEPYVDVYYFAYKEGIMISRFSICSNAEVNVKNMKGEIIRQGENDISYETYVQFK